MWMRARVGAQFITIGFMMPWFYYNYNRSSSAAPAAAPAAQPKQSEGSSPP
jgi:hypothetical protein